MRIKSIWMLFLCASLMGMTACGDGAYEEKKLKISEFHSLELENLFVGTFEQSNQYSVTIEVPKKVHELLKTKVKDGRVSILLDTEQMSRSDYRHLDLYRPRVKIKAPTFRKVELRNACYLTFAGDFNLTQAKLEVRGASDVKVDRLTAEQLELDLSGSSHADIGKMKLGQLKLDLSGASSLNSNSVDAEAARIDLSGASSLKWIGFVNAGHLEASGASAVDWTPLYDKKGERFIVDVSGVSKIKADHVRFNEVNVETSGLSSVHINGQNYE